MRIIKQKQRYYCKTCCNEYLEKKWADKCQAWCQENDSCNLEVIKHAI